MQGVPIKLMKDFEFKIAMNQKLSELADIILYQYNPCQLDRVHHKCVYRSNLNEMPCCTFFHCSKGDPCVFLGEEGKCQYTNVFCKISLCDEAKKRASPECIKAMTLIEELAKIYGLLRYRLYT